MAENNFLKLLQKPDEQLFQEFLKNPNNTTSESGLPPLTPEQLAEASTSIDTASQELPVNEQPQSESGLAPLTPDQLANSYSTPETIDVLPKDEEPVPLPSFPGGNEQSNQQQTEQPEQPGITNKTLLDEYRELLKQRDIDVKDARQRDRKAQMWGALGDILGATTIKKLS